MKKGDKMKKGEWKGKQFIGKAIIIAVAVIVVLNIVYFFICSAIKFYNREALLRTNPAQYADESQERYETAKDYRYDPANYQFRKTHGEEICINEFLEYDLLPYQYKMLISKKNYIAMTGESESYGLLIERANLLSKIPAFQFKYEKTNKATYPYRTYYEINNRYYVQSVEIEYAVNCFTGKTEVSRIHITYRQY